MSFANVIHLATKSEKTYRDQLIGKASCCCEVSCPSSLSRLLVATAVGVANIKPRSREADIKARLFHVELGE